MTSNVVDLFAGAGGLSLGFKQTGFKLLGAVEVGKHQCETYHQNLPDVKVHQEDLRDVRAESFMGLVEVVVGSPPYDAFLATNKERKAHPLARIQEDHHGALVLAFIDFVAAVRPKAFVLELCPDFAEDALMELLGAEFGKAGYPQVYVNFLNAADYGAVTDRVSLFVSNVPLEPEPPAEPGPPVGEVVEHMKEGLTNHEIEALPEEKIVELSKLKHGDCLEPIPINANGESYPNWLRLVPAATAPPLYGFSRFVHPFADRLLTVRETGRIMGFPDNWVFTGNRSLQYDSVGNAVPPPLARAVAREVMNALHPQVAEAPAPAPAQRRAKVA